ncbi:insulinase family protein [Acinetobacter sp. 187]|uniref:M16 family metallopeptidase n=1 Tax=Acinetobacter lanii TaxID=2715163 RepID=UPI001409AC85|nr:pitrilysin family protein [Acinetobacter lanii]NHC04098.1 insulinase family protein [Acinetobacter lanii]
MLMRLKKLTVALWVLGVSAGSFAQTVLVKSEQNIEEYKLDNGLRVILAPNDKESKIFMNTVYLTGALNDPQGKGGLAHLLEHLAFKGTENVKGEEYQRRLDQYTLMSNASTDYYSTKYMSVIRPEKTAIDEMIYLEAERMDKLVLQEKFVPSEINIVMREREVRMDQPYAVLMDQMWKSAYGNQSLGRLPIGDLKELQSIKMDELNTFYRKWYAPNNAVMVIAGKFDKADVLKAIDKNFSGIPARSIPESAKVPNLDSTQMKVRQFMVQKGSDFGKFNIYLNGKNPKIQTALSVAPYLYTMQPSGHLYKDIVENGIATNVQATTWLAQDFNLVFLGAIYAPNHDEKKVGAQLNSSVEKPQNFTDTELSRIKNLVKNNQKAMMSSASAVGGILSDYVVSSNGDWTKFFRDQDELMNLDVKQVNQVLSEFLSPEHRITGDVKPTPEDQKKAQQQAQVAELGKTLDQQDQVVEPLKDVSVYKAEVADLLKKSTAMLNATEKKIQRGQLKNGMPYAFYPTITRDDKTYASIAVDFGTAESLMNKSEIIDLTAYLLLRASKDYSLQDIADKSIASGGSASASASDNGMNIQIVANKENFADFFDYIVKVMKSPKFEQTQFDLIKSQSLSSLNRPYTEPETVASLTIARIAETFQPGDLRYHFEPDFAKKQLEAATVEQVKQFYADFFNMDHAKIAITGDIDSKAMLKYLNTTLKGWTGKQPYAKLSEPFTAYPAQKKHVLSEQREFGSYQSFLTFPVGNDHPDAVALMVFGYVLGESQLSSRLAMELREKNALVYGFSSGQSFSEDSNSGALTISANYTAGKSAQVSQAVHKVLTDLLNKGITEQELEAAKANIMKKRVTSLEDERRIHRMLVAQLDKKRDLPYRKKRDQAFAQLTKADVDAAIKKYIKLDQLVEVMADQYGQPTDLNASEKSVQPKKNTVLNKAVDQVKSAEKMAPVK